MKNLNEPGQRVLGRQGDINAWPVDKVIYKERLNTSQPLGCLEISSRINIFRVVRDFYKSDYTKSQLENWDCNIQFTPYLLPV